MPKEYDDVTKYVNDIIEKQGVFLEVRCIKDKLFIEKIEFMALEGRSITAIFKELISRPDITDIVKRFKGKLESDSLVPIVSRFNYAVNFEKILMYIIWQDKDGNTFKPQNNVYEILNEGDTYQIN